MDQCCSMEGEKLYSSFLSIFLDITCKQINNQLLSHYDIMLPLQQLWLTRHFPYWFLFLAATNYLKQLFFYLKFLLLYPKSQRQVICEVSKITFVSFSEISRHEKLVCFTSYCICYLYHQFSWTGIWFYVQCILLQ